MSTTSDNPTRSQPMGPGYEPSGASGPSQPPTGAYQPPPGGYQSPQGHYGPQQGQYQQQQGPYQPQQSQYPPQPGQYQQLPPAPKKPNILGMVALGVAAVGFILAMVPATHFVGFWVLPVAFVLSVVALFMKDQSKKWAVVALTTSLIGGIAGGAMFALTMVNAIDEAIKSETTYSEPAVVPADQLADDAQEPAEEPAGAEQPVSGELGTRTNPLAMGSTVIGDDWEVTVNSFTADATAEVMAVDDFNDPPEAGKAWSLTNVTVKYTGTDSGLPFEIGVDYVSDTGNVFTEYDAIAFAPDDVSSLGELFEGGEATGNIVIQIPLDATGTLRVEAGMMSDGVFVATS